MGDRDRRLSETVVFAGTVLDDTVFAAICHILAELARIIKSKAALGDSRQLGHIR